MYITLAKSATKKGNPDPIHHTRTIQTHKGIRHLALRTGMVGLRISYGYNQLTLHVHVHILCLHVCIHVSFRVWCIGSGFLLLFDYTCVFSTCASPSLEINPFGGFTTPASSFKLCSNSPVYQVQILALLCFDV